VTDSSKADLINLSDAQLSRYSRHILLDDIGIEAQNKICASTALVVGAGGLGSPAAMYLASAGVGHIILADNDTVDITNLQRQIMHTTDRVGMSKVESGANALSAINPTIRITSLNKRLEEEALIGTIKQCDVVLDCSDNFATRHAVNAACIALKVPLVSGSAIRFDGQLSVFDFRRSDSPCYACLFPKDQAPEEVRCSEMGVFAPLTGIIGTMQAAEALKILGGFGEPAVGKLMMIDARTMGVSEMRFRKVLSCAGCGESSRTQQ
jgi:molybdopterin-synthase adenylyltransferase